MVSDLDTPTQHGTFSTNQTGSIEVGSTLLSVSKGAPQGYVLDSFPVPPRDCVPAATPLSSLHLQMTQFCWAWLEEEKKQSRGCSTWDKSRETKGAFFWTQTSQRSSHGHTTQTQQRLFLASVHHCSFEDVTWPTGRAAALQLREEPRRAIKSTHWPALDGISTPCCLQRETNIFEDSSQPTYHLFELLPSVRQHRNTPHWTSQHCAAVKSNSNLGSICVYHI